LARAQKCFLARQMADSKRASKKEPAMRAPTPPCYLESSDSHRALSIVRYLSTAETLLNVVLS